MMLSHLTTRYGYRHGRAGGLSTCSKMASNTGRLDEPLDMRFALAVDVRKEEKLPISLEHEAREMHGSEVVLTVASSGINAAASVSALASGTLDREVKDEMTLTRGVSLVSEPPMSRVDLRARASEIHRPEWMTVPRPYRLMLAKRARRFAASAALPIRLHRG